MLPRRRRIPTLVASCLLAAPLVVGLIAPDSPASVLREGRSPASAPRLPTTDAGWRGLPAAVDAYVKDHFGLREKMIRLHKDLTKPLFTDGNGMVVTGASGRKYAVADDMIAQSAGRTFRSEKVADTVAMIVGIRDALARRGVKFLVAVPPNSATIYQDDLPNWARNPGKATEYDLLLEALAARGVKTVDLRPAVKEARALGPTYLLNDLHWNIRGAVAGFNALVEADGHPDWEIDPSSAVGPIEEKRGGDVATLEGIADTAVEMAPSFILKTVGRDELLSHGLEGRIEGALQMADHEIVSDRPGPTIMVIGDSFTFGYFPPFLSQHVGQAVWFHHNYCGFDWAAIDKVRPDEVWWMPVERLILCRPGQKLKNFPEGEARGSASNEN